MSCPYRSLAAIFAAGLMVSGVQAQDTVRFQFKRGQVLQYEVEQKTRAIDASSEGKSEHTSRSQQTKRWQVVDVGSDGSATLQLSLTRLTMHQTLPNGETWTFDSNTPDRSHKKLKEMLSPLVGKPIAIVKLDITGRVIESKPLIPGTPNRFQSELPFAIIVPGSRLQSGQGWSRSYNIVLDPPLGTGEKFAAEQNYQAKSDDGNQWIISFSTTIKDLPENPGDRLPLLQMQPRGEAIFDAKLGIVTETRITSGGTIEGHAGDGSRYEFASDYQEKLIRR